MKWRIYYEDGTTFTDEDGSMRDAPAWGIIAIVADVIDDNPQETTYWHCGDFAGLIDFLARSGIVKFGRSTGNPNYVEIIEQARNDPDFSQFRSVNEQGDFYWYHHFLNQDDLQ